MLAAAGSNPCRLRDSRHRFVDPFSLRLAVRYLGEEMGGRYVAMTEGQDSISLLIRPRKIVEFDGRAGRDS